MSEERLEKSKADVQEAADRALLAIREAQTGKMVMDSGKKDDDGKPIMVPVADFFAGAIGDINRAMTKAKATTGIEIPARGLDMAKTKVEESVMWFDSAVKVTKKPNG